MPLPRWSRRADRDPALGSNVRQVGRRKSASSRRRCRGRIHGSASGVTPDPALAADQAVLDHRELRELAVHIHPDIPDHPRTPSPATRRGTAGQNDTYGYALPAQPDQSQGRPPTTRTRSPLCKNGLPIRVPRDAPVPDGRTVCPATAAGLAEQHAGIQGISYRVPTPSSRSTPGSGGRPAPAVTSAAEQGALNCRYLAIMSLDPAGKGLKRWTSRWKAALNAFDITFDGRLSAGRN
jgi:hypothetical protein